LDWGHLHSRELGRFKKVEDFRVVVEKVEEELGTDALRSMHCHFSAIEFNSQGEKEHHALDEKRYGPDFKLLAEVIADFQMHPTMICESPVLDVDARKMKETLAQVLESRKQTIQ
jgi:deoxyribonuclease-4